MIVCDLNLAHDPNENVPAMMKSIKMYYKLELLLLLLLCPTLVLFDAHMAHGVVQLEGQRENVMIVGAVAHNETAVRFVAENLFGRLAGYRSPIPTVLNFGDNFVILCKYNLYSVPNRPLSLSQCWPQNPFGYRPSSSFRRSDRTPGSGPRPPQPWPIPRAVGLLEKWNEII